MMSSVIKKSDSEERNEKDFYFGKLIGEGSFSSVFLAKDVHNQKEYAIKKCEMQHIYREKKVDLIKREKEVMEILNSNQNSTSPFFVKLYYAFKSRVDLYFVMTYCKNGELLDVIKKCRTLDKECSSFYSAEITRALEHLHSLKIIHRDLKPENILLDDKMHIKLADFGSAKILGNQDLSRTNSFVGTAQYVSPEVLDGKSVTPATDLWALGCIVYQMLAGKPPFNEGSEYLIFKQIKSLNFSFPEGFDSDAKDLVQKLLVIDSSSRLGASNNHKYSCIRSHCFLSHLDLDSIYLMNPPKVDKIKVINTDSNVEWDLCLRPGLHPELELGAKLSPSHRTSKNEESLLLSKLNLSNLEIDSLLIAQGQQNEYHRLVEGKFILKQGILDKRKGLSKKRRMFLLTLGPRIFYVDPVKKILMGEIPFGPTLKPDPKNFKTFDVITPDRTYFLEDPAENSKSWVEALETVSKHYFPQGGSQT